MVFIDWLTSILVNKLLKYKIIDEEDKNIYMFGIYQLIGFIFNTVSSFIIFMMFDKLKEGFVFFITYSILRSFAGGYHSKSICKCYIFSLLIILFSVCFMNISFDCTFIIELYVICSIIIYTLAPVDTKNKRLSNIERNAYGLITKRILVILMIINIVILRFEYFWMNISIIGAVVFVSIMMIIGIIFNKITE